MGHTVMSHLLYIDLVTHNKCIRVKIIELLSFISCVLPVCDVCGYKMFISYISSDYDTEDETVKINVAAMINVDHNSAH